MTRKVYQADGQDEQLGMQDGQRMLRGVLPESGKETAYNIEELVLESVQHNGCVRVYVHKHVSVCLSSARMSLVRVWQGTLPCQVGTS